MVLLEGLSISGEEVIEMKDKCVVVAKPPRYETFQEEGKPDTKKPVICIKLPDKTVADYYPNKTSQKVLKRWWGGEMDNWVGKKFHLKTVEQNVRGDMKLVVYVDEKAAHD